MQSVRLLTLLLVMGLSVPVVADSLDKARSYFQAGEYSASIIEAKNALQKNPGDLEARLILARAYLALYKGAEAEKEFYRVKQLGGSPDQWVVGLAKALFYQGKSQELLDQLPLDPDYDDTTYAALAGWRAYAYLSLNQPDAAEKAIQAGEARQAEEPELLLGKARLLLAQQKRDQAKALLEGLTKRNAGLAEAHAMLGSIARAEKDDEAARRHYLQALEAEPDNLSAHVGLASLNIAEKRFDEAEKHIDRVLKLVPGHIYATYLSALVDLERGRQEEAERKVDFVLQNTPDYKPAIFAKGMLLLNARKYEQADRYLALYLQSHPDNWLVAEWLAFAKLRIGEPEEALEVLEKYGNDKRSNYYVLRGSAQMALKQFEASSESFEKALEMAPGSRIAERELALARLNLGDLSRLERLFEENAEMGELLFIAKMRERHHAEAARIAQKLISRERDNPVYHNMLGLALLAQQKLDEAERAFQAALEADPDYLTARFNLARIHDLQGDLEQAEKLYREVNRRKPNPAAYIGLANIAMKRGELKQAEALLQKAVELDDDAKVYLARFYLRSGQGERAIELLRREKTPRALSLLVEGYLQEGKVDEAIEVARRMGDDPRVLSLLARLYLAKGDRKAARTALQRALKQAPDDVAVLQQLAGLAVAEKDQANFGKWRDRLKELRGAKDPLVVELEGDWALAQGRFQQAMEYYERLITAGRASGAVWRKYDLATVRGQAQQRARKTYAAHLERHPDDVAARRRYAMLLQSLGETAASEREYQRVLAEVKDDPVTLNNLAWLYIEKGDRKAVELSEQAYQLAPQNAGIADTHGWALIRFGEVDKGVRLLKEWLPKVGDGRQRREIQYHLAYGLIQSGKSEEAAPLIAELESAGATAWVEELKTLQKP